VELTTFDNQPSEMFAAIADKQFAALTFAFSASLVQLQPIITQASVFNPFAVSAPEVDQAFEDFARADEEQTQDAAQEVSRAIHEAAWFAPVASVESYVFSKGVENIGDFTVLTYDVLNWTPAS
jgi:peptide/nickel transport system substrate-binding protein